MSSSRQHLRGSKKQKIKNTIGMIGYDQVKQEDEHQAPFIYSLSTAIPTHIQHQFLDRYVTRLFEKTNAFCRNTCPAQVDPPRKIAPAWSSRGGAKESFSCVGATTISTKNSPASDPRILPIGPGWPKWYRDAYEKYSTKQREFGSKVKLLRKWVKKELPVDKTCSGMQKKIVRQIYEMQIKGHPYAYICEDGRDSASEDYSCDEEEDCADASSNSSSGLFRSSFVVKTTSAARGGTKRNKSTENHVPHDLYYYDQRFTSWDPFAKLNGTFAFLTAVLAQGVRSSWAQEEALTKALRSCADTGIINAEQAVDTKAILAPAATSCASSSGGAWSEIDIDAASQAGEFLHPPSPAAVSSRNANSAGRNMKREDHEQAHDDNRKEPLLTHKNWHRGTRYENLKRKSEEFPLSSTPWSPYYKGYQSLRTGVLKHLPGSNLYWSKMEPENLVQTETTYGGAGCNVVEGNSCTSGGVLEQPGTPALLVKKHHITGSFL